MLSQSYPTIELFDVMARRVDLRRERLVELRSAGDGATVKVFSLRTIKGKLLVGTKPLIVVNETKRAVTVAWPATRHSQAVSVARPSRRPSDVAVALQTYAHSKFRVTDRFVVRSTRKGGELTVAFDEWPIAFGGGTAVIIGSDGKAAQVIHGGR